MLEKTISLVFVFLDLSKIVVVVYCNAQVILGFPSMVAHLPQTAMNLMFSNNMMIMQKSFNWKYLKIYQQDKKYLLYNITRIFGNYIRVLQTSTMLFVT